MKLKQEFILQIISGINLIPPTRQLIPFGKRTKENRSLFQAEPESIIFKSYLTGNMYEVIFCVTINLSIVIQAIVKIRNISDSSRPIRILPPKTTYFSINEGKYVLNGNELFYLLLKVWLLVNLYDIAVVSHTSILWNVTVFS